MPVTRREQRQKIGWARAGVVAETISALQDVAGGSGAGQCHAAGGWSNEFVSPVQRDLAVA